MYPIDDSIDCIFSCDWEISQGGIEGELGTVFGDKLICDGIIRTG